MGDGLYQSLRQRIWDRIVFLEERDKFSFQHVDFEVLVDYPNRNAYQAFENLGLYIKRKVQV